MTLRQSQGPCKFCIAYIALTFFALIANLHILCPGFNALSDDWSARKLAWLLDLPNQYSRSTILGRYRLCFFFNHTWRPCTKSLAVQLLPNNGVYYHPIVWRVKENLTDLLQSTSPLTTRTDAVQRRFPRSWSDHSSGLFMSIFCLSRHIISNLSILWLVPVSRRSLMLELRQTRPKAP